MNAVVDFVEVLANLIGVSMRLFVVEPLCWETYPHSGYIAAPPVVAIDIKTDYLA